MIASFTDDQFRVMRHAMVTSQLRTNAVSDARVVAAIDQVAREDFTPLATRELAYRDTALPLGGGRALNVPMATGRLLSEAELDVADRVLLIAAATGYTAAVLAQLVAEVTAVEVDAHLAAQATTLLAGAPNVTMENAPLADGAPTRAPYDVIVIDGAVPDVPDALWQQLRPGGRIVTGLVQRGVTRLAAGRRSANGKGLTAFADADCIVLPGFERPRGFAF